MALERTYIVPLRRHWLMVPHYRRAKKAVAALQAFIIRHMKSDNIRIGKHLNEAIWARGMKNPPHKIKVTVVKEDDGLVKVELFGKEYVEYKRTPKEEQEAGLVGKLKGAMGKATGTEESEEKEQGKEKGKESKEGKDKAKPEEKKAEPKKEAVPAKDKNETPKTHQKPEPKKEAKPAAKKEPAKK